MRAASGALAVGTALLLTAQGVMGQYHDRERLRRPTPRAHLSVSFLVADPVGDFGRLVDDGYGADLEGRLAAGLDGALSLRADVGLLVYGYERERVCLNAPIGCRIALDLTTSNSILFFGAGPELALPGPVSPFVNGSVGVSYFTTSSSLSGSDGGHDFARTEHFGDAVLVSRLGGGVRLRLSPGRFPVSIVAGADYHHNGIAEYLVEGGIVDHPDGSVTLFPNRTEADLVAYRLGVSVGLGGGDGWRERPRQPRRGRRWGG